MKLSHYMLLAGVAAISLGACSSSAGPGEIGSRDDIVVRNHGSVPAPQAAEEAAMLAQGADGKVAVADMQTAAGDAEDMVPRTPEGAQAMADAAEPAIRQNVEEAAVPMGEKPAMMSPAVPDEAVSADAGAPAMAAARTSSANAGQGEAIAEPMPATSVEPTPSATVEVPVSATAEATAEVTQPAIDAAATEFAQEGVAEASEEALANPPVSPPEPAIAGGTAAAPAATSAVDVSSQPMQAAPAPVAAPAPAAPAPASVPVAAAPAAPVAAAPAAAPSYPQNTDAIRPTPEQLSSYGMRVVKNEDGTLQAKPYEQSVAEGLAPATAAAPAAQTQQVASAPQAAASVAAPAPAAPVSAIAPVTFNPQDPTFLRTVQKTLTEKGFYSGPISGENSSDLMNSVVRYQAANGLSVGPLTQETARHMGLVK